MSRFPQAAPDADGVPVDHTLASIGRDSVGVAGGLLESMGLWPFTTQLGWTAAQFDTFMQQVRAELQDVNLRLYFPM